MGTRGQWATDFAKALGNNEPSADIVNWLSAWTKAEGTKARFNPLATTWDNGDNTLFNSVGVRNYKSRQAGIVATVKTLRGNHPGYATIIDGILTNNVAKCNAGLARAPWGTNPGLVRGYSMRDVRNESLLAEEGANTTEPSYSDRNKDETIITPLTNANATKVNETVVPMGTTVTNTDGAGRVLNGMLGLLILLLVLFLFIRRYVPTAQIVKTIEATT